jgi:hypothetical protein
VLPAGIIRNDVSEVETASKSLTRRGEISGPCGNKDRLKKRFASGETEKGQLYQRASPHKYKMYAMYYIYVCV